MEDINTTFSRSPNVTYIQIHNNNATAENEVKEKNLKAARDTR